MVILEPEPWQCPTGVLTLHMLGTASSPLSCQAGSRYLDVAQAMAAACVHQLSVTGTSGEIEGWAVTLV